MDLKREKVEVDRLVLGMYVAELDRPWIDTPFLLQGFLLDDPEDVHTLMSTCTFVYIDRTKSLGNQYVAPAKQSVAIKREGSVVRLKEPKSKISNQIGISLKPKDCMVKSLNRIHTNWRFLIC